MRQKYPKIFSRNFKILRQRREKMVAQLDLYIELEGLERELKVKKENFLLDLDCWGDVSLTIDGANNFKDGILYLKWFYKKGYRQGFKPELSTECKRMKYNMKKGNHWVTFCLYLSDKSQCEMVKVGEEMVTIPKYRLVCP